MFKSGNILRQEEEFLKLNDEINLKTDSLLKEVEYIKEISSDPDKLCKNWEKLPESDSSINVANSSGKDFDLSEYFSKLNSDESNGCAGIAASVDSEKVKSERETSKEKRIRNKRRLSLSAKAFSCPISTTDLGQQGLLPPVTGKHKSDSENEKFDSDLVPDSVKGIGQEGIYRFLTAKVKVLADQLRVVRQDEKKHLEKIKELQAFKEKAAEEQNRLTQQLNSAKNVIVKYEQHSNGLMAKFQTTQAENGNLKKELEGLKKEMRQNKQNANANELKLNRTLEELDKLKATIQTMKQEEKESREMSRKKIENLTSSIKKVDKQRAELLNGFKKQLLIVDNLKRQKGLMEVAKMLKIAEDDFNNFLDCHPKTDKFISTKINSRS